MKTFFVRIKALFLAVVIVLLTVFSTGCFYRGYIGEYPEAYTVALSNIPGLHGYSGNGEAIWDPYISIIEKDGYGRTLFSYSENGINEFIIAVQQSDEENVLYYPDDCYVFIENASENDNGNVSDFANQNEYEALKELNDWEKPIDESKCESAEIIKIRQDGRIRPNDALFEKIVREYHENSGRNIHPANISFVGHFDYLCSDDFGKELFVVYTGFEEYTDKTKIQYNYTFLVVLNPDMSYDASTVVIIEDITTPANQMKTIKDQNGWNASLK